MVSWRMTIPGLEISCPISSLFALNQISDILQCSLRRNIEKESKNGRKEQIEEERDDKSNKEVKRQKKANETLCNKFLLNIIVQVESTKR